MANDLFFSNNDRKIDYMHLPKILHLLSGMTVTLFDANFHHLLSYPVDPCDFCRLVRANQDSYGLCRQSDREAHQICLQKRGLYVYCCPMGLYEVLVPIYHQEILSGFFMAGQVMDDSDESRTRTFELARGFLADEEQLKMAIQKLTCISGEKLQAILQMLEVYAGYISENNVMPNKDLGLAYCIRQYINDHLAVRFSNADLCRTFHCSNKTLTEAFRKAYHTTIVQYTNDMRLKRAKSMLTNHPERSIHHIALSCGFSDQGYFCKLYWKKFGVTPTETVRMAKKG